MSNLFQLINTYLGNGKSSTDNKYKPLNPSQYAAYNRFRPEGSKPIFCYLPFNSLTFSMSGNVYVCNYNKNILLGRYPENTITEIWKSDQALKLRGHMRNNDLEYGCNHCKFYFDKGKFTNLRPLAFDKYHTSTSADFPLVMEFELSNECNLECQMCNGNVSSSIRKKRDNLPPLHNPYDAEFVVQLEPYILKLREAKFYGGEPFLIPIYYKIWERLTEVNPSCNIFLITNGTHWNSKIKKLIEDLNLDIAISIDSLQKERLESIRKNANFENLIENIALFNEVLQKKGKTLSLSFTIQQENWQELPTFINYCNEIKASVYISYIDSPKKYAISELKNESLQQILEELSPILLPSNSALEQHNAQCLKDFLTYVRKYLENEKEPQYEDYAYFPEYLNEEARLLLKSHPLIKVRKPLSRDELQLAIDHYLKKNTLPFSASDLVNRIDKVYFEVPMKDKPKIYGMIYQNNLSKTLQLLCDKDIEELREMALWQVPLIIIE